MYLPGVRRQEYSVVDVKEEDTRAFIEDALVPILGMRLISALVFVKIHEFYMVKL